MTSSHPKQSRILAIAPCSKGFGFAVMEGDEVLVDWGVRNVKGEKNASSLVKLKAMILHYQPDILVFQDLSAQDSRRSSRIRRLGKQMVALAARHKVKVKLFSREKIAGIYFPEAQCTKQQLAELLAQRFPKELGHRLPPKRKAWMSQDTRMDLFDAVALALAVWLSKS